MTLNNYVQRVREQHSGHQYLADLFLILAVLFIVAQGIVIKRHIDESARAAPSVVRYSSVWVPEPKVRHPGDIIHFDYVRHTDQAGVLLVFVDGFDNLDTGVTYPGGIAARIIPKTGVERVTAVRTLPESLTPGRYVLRGWAQVQGEKRMVPIYYESLPFTVTGKEKEKVK